MLAKALQITQSITNVPLGSLGRLARNVRFISGLIESGVQFRAADMPNADRFMLHVYAAMAEEEGRRITLPQCIAETAHEAGLAKLLT